MLGIDLVRISRFKNAKISLVQKILHPAELKEFNASSNKSLFLAKRWAIKEALFKSDNALVKFNKIRIGRKDNIYKFPGFWISTSREGDYYIAIVKKMHKKEKWCSK